MNSMRGVLGTSLAKLSARKYVRTEVPLRDAVAPSRTRSLWKVMNELTLCSYYSPSPALSPVQNNGRINPFYL